MATKRICSIEGCGKLHKARGLCGAHYFRWQHYGAPTDEFEPEPRQPCCIKGCDKPQRTRGLCLLHYSRWQRDTTLAAPRQRVVDGTTQHFIKTVALRHRSNECLIWPFRFGRGSYPRCCVNGKSVHAHRHVCELVHGRPPTPRHQAAHGCGNRKCVNPRHLRWATAKENRNDSIIHGTIARGERQGSAKLTRDSVREMRARGKDATYAEIGARYGVAGITARNVMLRKTWAWLD